MISRSFRFHGYGSLSHVYRHGQVLRGPLALIRFEPNPKRKTGRAAVVVSKKVHKSAVVRNRIRRRVFEVVRRSEVLVERSVDMVITIHDERVATIPTPQLEGAFKPQLDRIRKAISSGQ